MNNCTCPKCSQADSEKRLQALAQYKQGKYEVEFKPWYYECGDGCCSDSGIALIINGYEVTNDYESYGGAEEILKFFGEYTDVSSEDDY